MRHFFATFFVFFLCVFATHAEEWMSSDGLFSFTVPESFVRDTEIPLQQYQLQHWGSEECACLLSVMRMSVPEKMTSMNLNSFMEGFRQSLVDEQGKPLPDIKTHHSESGKTKEGFFYGDVTMSAWFPMLESQVYMRQHVVLINGNAYYILVNAYTEDPQNIPAINECIASIKINATPKRPSIFGQGGDSETRMDLFVQGIGRMSFFCLFIALIVYLVSKAFRKPKPLPPTRKQGGGNTPFEG
jgi:hypothetical protein